MARDPSGTETNAKLTQAMKVGETLLNFLKSQKKKIIGEALAAAMLGRQQYSYAQINTAAEGFIKNFEDKLTKFIISPYTIQSLNELLVKLDFARIELTVDRKYGGGEIRKFLQEIYFIMKDRRS